MNYSTVLLDLDNTILSFDAAENYALRKLFTTNNLEWNQAIANKYDQKNKELWQGLEQGIYEKDYVISERFVYLFNLFDRRVDGSEMDQLFRSYLSEEVFLMPEAVKVLDELRARQIELNIVTNGVGITQKKRLKKANLNQYFNHLFISEEIGYQKPAPEFFEQVFTTIAEKEKPKILMVGDSLSADITGGVRAGIDTCWYTTDTPTPENPIQPTYQIKQLSELLVLV